MARKKKQQQQKPKGGVIRMGPIVRSPKPEAVTKAVNNDEKADSPDR